MENLTKIALTLLLAILHLQPLLGQTSPPVIHKPANTYQKSYSSNKTPYSFSYTPYTDGTAAQNRIVVALVSNEYTNASTTNSISGVTIAGKAMSRIGVSRGSNNDLENEITAYYIKESDIVDQPSTVQLVYINGQADLKSVGVEMFTISNVNQNSAVESTLQTTFKAQQSTGTVNLPNSVSAIDNSLVIAAITAGKNSATYTAGSGYTPRLQRSFPNHSYASTYKTVASAGPESPLFNITTNANTRVAMLAFRVDPHISLPLPINLIYFKAQLSGESVKLSWATAQEENNSEFIVERSSDGTTWDKVAEMPGAVNSNVKLNYAINDFDPLLGISYYRLKQKDLDGTTTTFKVVSVVRSDIKELEARIYPNPADEFVHVSFKSKTEPLSVKLIDANGKTLSIPFKQNHNGLVLDIAALSSGLYHLKVITEEKTYIKKLLIK